MSHSQLIRSNDIAALLRLVNELHDLHAASVIERHEHMLRGLAALLGAQYAVSTVLRTAPRAAGEARLAMFVYHGWTDDAPERRNTLNEYLRTLEPVNPARPPMLRLLRTTVRDGDDDTPITRTRQQLVDDRTWYESAYVQHVHRPIGADHALFSLLSMHRSGNGSGNGTGSGNSNSNGAGNRGAEQLATGLCVMRPWGERRSFEPRDSMLLRAFHSTAQWMFRQDSARALQANATAQQLSSTAPVVAATMPTSVILSPRQKQTLRLLLNGDSEKQIATKLLRSRHTVHEHVKAIYRAAGVSSRGELLARFLQRRRSKRA